jgi:hypothetical protein
MIAMDFDRALGRDADGPSYDPRPVRREGPIEKVRAFLWYRFGWGHRPRPRR